MIVSLDRMPDRNNNLFWIFFTVTCVIFTQVFVAIIFQQFSYNKWDNFEYFTPIIYESHSQWLRGILPLVNPYQFLGEPILANAQPGVFYLPYTISVLISKLVGAGPGLLMNIIFFIHLIFSAVGWYLLFRKLNVRAFAASLTSISMCSGSFLIMISSVWIFMVVIFSWLPWILYGCINTSDNGIGSRNSLWLPAGLSAVAFVGHVQMTVYVWLWTILYIIGLSFYKKDIKFLPRIFWLLASSILISCLPMLPVVENYLNSRRAQGLELAEFLARSTRPEDLLSFFLPVIQSANEYLRHLGSLTYYQGSWAVFTVIIIALYLLYALIKRKNTAFDKIDSLMFYASISIMAIFIIFGLGQYGYIYKFTYRVPVWSNFRWPFKFVLLAMASFGICSGIALEYWIRFMENQKVKSLFTFLSIGFGVFLICLVFLRFSNIALSFFGLVALLTSIVSVILQPWIKNKIAQTIFALCVVIGSMALVGMAQGSGMKTYREDCGSYGPNKFGINTDYRIIPITSGLYLKKPIMQSLALFESATANKYFSATGCSTGLISFRLFDVLPADVTGCLYREFIDMYTKSNLLKSFNVKYAAIWKSDAPACRIVEKNGFKRHSEIEDSVIYIQDNVLERAYFAEKQLPYEHKAFLEGLLFNNMPVKTAFVENSNENIIFPEAKIEKSIWHENYCEFEIDAPKGGLLIISLGYYPQWHVRVDDKVSKVLKVNGAVMGVKIPAGSKHVKFEFQSASLKLGLCSAVAGIILLLLRLR